MDSSRYTRPSTSIRPRSGQDSRRVADEGRAPSGRAGHDWVLVRAYERFFDLPVVLVVVALWLVGVALLGSCALALYLLGSLLVQVLN